MPYEQSDAVEDAWLAAYSDVDAHWDVYALAEKITSLEYYFQEWRFKHIKTVVRMIGQKMGTGGSSGVNYLVKALNLSFFPEVWSMRTRMVAEKDGPNYADRFRFHCDRAGGDRTRAYADRRQDRVFPVSAAKRDCRLRFNIGEHLQGADGGDLASPGPPMILSESTNFPTGVYMMQGIEAFSGGRLQAVTIDPDALLDRLDDDVAVLLLTQVHYKSGRIRDMAEITRRAHEKGALVVWNLSHSAGAIEVISMAPAQIARSAAATSS